jgi:small GTP-binding protein
LNILGVEFGTKTILVDGDPMKIQIWDTAGQEQYKSLTVNFYRNAHGALIVYDMTDLSSFENVKSWLELLNSNGPKDILKILVANKCDAKDRVAISLKADKISNFLQDNGFSAFFETSAKENINVQETFTSMAKLIKEAYYPKTPKTTLETEKESQLIKITKSGSNNICNKDKSSCCSD